ncbi:MAG: ABC transporter ATP-binding protein [Oligoflexales bacterium]
MIELDSVAKSYPGVQLLKDINIKVSNGERVSIVGPGGCGKTTVLKILLGLVAPDAGDVRLMGNSILGMSSYEREQIMKSVGMAFQQGGLFDFMTVKENLMFAMEHMTSQSASEMLETVRSLLEGVKLARTENMYPHELSGGMKRRVGIARALCTNPSIAIFDEPTSGLDPVTSTIILNMIGDLASGGEEKTLVVATSNTEIAVRFASRVIVINEGKVVADGPWRELLVNGSDWVKNFLGVRFIGLDLDYAYELDLPKAFISQHWQV